MLDLGPQIAIIDDKRDEVIQLEQTFTNLHIGYEFFNADLAEAKYPKEPIPSVEFIFLDLYYNEKFDAEICAQWVDSIIPTRKKYDLVVWSKDPHKVDELLGILEKIDKPPFILETKQKNFYQQSDGYNIAKLLTEVNNSLEEKEKTEVSEFYGQIIDYDEENVLVNCLLDRDKPTQQMRRFDRVLFDGYIPMELNNVISIKVTTKVGSRVFDFFEPTGDLRYLFEKGDYFKNIDGTPFMNSDK